jgi:zinc protease
VARHRLANGIEVWIAEQHALPRVALALAIRGGAERDPPGRAGLAALCADLIDEGSGSRSALELAVAFADEGAEFDAVTSHAGTVLRVWSLSDPPGLGRVLGLLADVATRPRFLGVEFERVRADRLTAIAARGDDPAAVADRILDKAIYGDAHAYGIPVEGRAGSLRRVRLQDVRAFWHRHYRPDNAALIAVGAVVPADLLRALQDAFGPWRTPPSERAPDPPPPTGFGPRLVVVDRPGASQSEIRLGHVGLARGHRDEFAVEVLATLLGGTFASRLNHRLREELGYTYGAWAGFALRRGAGPFVTGAAVRTDATAAAVREFASEVTRIREAEPSAVELRRARDGLLRGLPARFEGASAVAWELANLFLHGAPSDHFARYAERVAAVTAQDVHRAAAEHLRPEQLQIAIVGDRAAIEADLAAAGLGAPEIWDAEGTPVR